MSRSTGIRYDAKVPRTFTVPVFNYEAASKDGSLTRGAIEAPTRSLAVEKILGQGQTPIRVTEQAGGGAVRLLPALAMPTAMASTRTRVTLLQELSVLLKAGLTVERALATLVALSSNQRTRDLIESVLESLRGGEPLSGALRRGGEMFPEPMRRLVAAGEASGRLPEVIMRIAESEVKSKRLSDKVISAMIYPALLVVTMLAVLTLIFTSVLPQLEPLFEESGAALPWPAATLLAVSHLFEQFGMAIAGILVLMLAASLYLLRQPATRIALDRHAITARYLLNIPLYYQSAQFCRNLAMLVEGGMPLNRALEAAQQTISNSYMRSKLGAVIGRVKHGRTLKSAMEEASVFPRIAIEFVAVGEETGRISPMLQEAAEIFERDVETRLERLSSLLLPAVTILLGLIVAGIMSGVVSGIFAANDLAL
jgi:general secretion pathway protein F